MQVHVDNPPSLPGWLEREMPWRRRTFRVEGGFTDGEDARGRAGSRAGGEVTRIHAVDEGAEHRTTVLLVHGNPTWSFLWRKVVSRLVPEDVRVLAPDLVGFGLSDKPGRVADHTLERHVEAMCRLVGALDPHRLILVGQDWGGPVAAGVGMRMAERVQGLVLANTSAVHPARPFRPKAFHRLAHVPGLSDALFRGLGFPLPVLDRVQGNPRSIGRIEKRAYRWPLRRFRDRAGPLALARMVPDAEAHPSTALLDAIGAWVEQYRGPAALVWGRRDPILGRALRRHREVLPQAEVLETTAGHFLQEEVPERLAHAIARVAEAGRASAQPTRSPKS